MVMVIVADQTNFAAVRQLICPPGAGVYVGHEIGKRMRTVQESISFLRPLDSSRLSCFFPVGYSVSD